MSDAASTAAPPALTPNQISRRGHLRDALLSFRNRAERNARHHRDRGELDLAVEYAGDSEWVDDLLDYGWGSDRP
jgi:hypothetical protein